MAVHDNTYSRIVAWLKILLPVIALALLSTMFLISRTIDPTRSIPFADVDFEDLVHDQRISSPKFSGVTSDGAAITFSAQSARPSAEADNMFVADGLSAQIETPDGGIMKMTSSDALIDRGTNRLTLRGGARIETSTEYLIESDEVTAGLDATYVETTGVVTATSPIGKFTAGNALFFRQGGEDGPYLLVFKDGVELVYDPQAEGSD